MSGLPRKKCTPKRASSNRAENKTVQTRHHKTKQNVTIASLWRAIIPGLVINRNYMLNRACRADLSSSANNSDPNGNNRIMEHKWGPAVDQNPKRGASKIATQMRVLLILEPSQKSVTLPGADPKIFQTRAHAVKAPKRNYTLIVQIQQKQINVNFREHVTSKRIIQKVRCYQRMT